MSGEIQSCENKEKKKKSLNIKINSVEKTKKMTSIVDFTRQ